jgi:flagellar biosynthesis/type III secretory pathway protein FliH
MEAAFSNKTDQEAVTAENVPEQSVSGQAKACIWKRFSEAIQRFEKERQAVHEQAAEEVLKLALFISEKIIHQEARVNPQIILNIIRKALQKSEYAQPIRIRIHPLDLEALKQADLDKACLEKDFKGITFHADELLIRGDCLIETNQGTLDAGIRRQLAFIEKAFDALGTDIRGNGAEVSPLTR